MTKSDTVLDYLMYYGWAILIVIVVVGSLWALDLLDPEAWTFSYELSCKSICINEGLEYNDHKRYIDRIVCICEDVSNKICNEINDIEYCIENKTYLLKTFVYNKN